MAVIILEFTVYLTDPVEVARLQAIPTPGPRTIADVLTGLPRHVPPGHVFVAPETAAATYDAPLLLDGAAYAAPCTTSSWFEGNPYPRNVKTFSQRSGGFWGFVKSLVGAGLHSFWWQGSFALAYPIAETSGDGPVAPLATRRWVEGFEAGTPGVLVGARAASRHTQGLGGLFDASDTEVTHAHVVASMPSESWERFYLRVRRLPTAAARFWRTQGKEALLAGIGLQLLPSGQLALVQMADTGVISVVGTTSAPVPVSTWVRIDVVYRCDTASAANTAYVFVVVDGVEVLNFAPGNAPAALRAVTATSGSVMGGRTATQFDAVYHIDDWINATPPGRSADGKLSGMDWTHGSRVALLGAAAFGSDHDADAWSGDWRTTRLHPRAQSPAVVLTSTTPSARLTVLTDASREIDLAPNQLGIAAFTVDAYAEQPDSGSGLGYRLPGGAAVLTPTNPAIGAANLWLQASYFPAALAAPLTPVAGLELLYDASAGAGLTTFGELVAQAEVIGMFGPEDVAPGQTVAPGLLPRARTVSVHNSPYPRTPWARPGPAPPSPVVVVSGRYTGNGVAQDLLFKAPVHFLVIRNVANVGLVHWWSSMVAAHHSGSEEHAAEAPVEVLIDPDFVPAHETVTGHDLPETPATVGEAVTLANAIAYADDRLDAGDSLWSNYASDPDYYFKRMLGWQAGGGDIPPHGAYAVPPSDWATHGALAGTSQATQTLVRIVGADVLSNAADAIYAWVAVCDPGRRFLECGALYVANGTVAWVHPLDNEAFRPEAALLQQEFGPNADNTPHAYYKGPGHSGAGVSPLHNAASIGSGLEFAAGTLTTRAGLAVTGALQAAYAAFRRHDGLSDPGVLQLASYVGDGSASRTVSLAPTTGRRPLWAIVVPHGAISWVRDPGHTGTTSSDSGGVTTSDQGITGGGIDSLSVGSVLNTAGVTFDVFVLVGTASACQNGWSCDAEVQYAPEAPTDPSWDPTPPDPEAPDDPGDGDPGDGGDDPGGDPTGPGFPASCIPASTWVINQALSRIGVSKQIATFATELSEEATAARLHYGSDVDAVLRDFPWPFATRYATLARVPPVVDGVTPTPVNGDWTYSFRLPANCVFARRLVKPGLRREPDPDPIRFRVGSDATGPLLYSDVEVAELEFTARPTCAATAGDALFRQALIWRHAHSLAPALARDDKKAGTCWAMYKMLLTSAADAAGNEGAPTHDGDASWITGRD